MVYRGHPDQRYGHVTYAQHGDDLMLLNIFDLLGVRRPTYIDIGAHHPETISNTKLLHDRGSRGVNVDPSLDAILQFVDERPCDINWQAAVVPKVEGDGLVTYYRFSPTSGRNTCSPSEVESLGGVLDVYDMQRVNAVTLDDVFSKFRRSEFIAQGAHYPDLLSVDIEGLDLEVLQSSNFNGVTGPRVVIVETREQGRKAMRQLMVGKQYAPLCRMGENQIFVRASDLTRVM